MKLSNNHGKPITKNSYCHEASASNHIRILKDQPYIPVTQEEFDKDNEEIAETLLRADR